MIKNFVFFLMSGLGFLQSSAQAPVVDSLYALASKINAIRSDKDCQKLDDFKTSISNLDPTNLDSALSSFIFSDSIFIKANKANSGCFLRKVISNLDTLLTALKTGERGPGSAQVLKAIRYLKYRISDSTLVRVQLAVASDRGAGITDPEIMLNSFAPSIHPPPVNDGTGSEFYLRRGKDYQITVSDSGYVPFSRQFSTEADTLLKITLQAIIVPDAGNTGKTVPASPGYWWITAVLLLLVLGALVWKILSGRKNSILPGPQLIQQAVEETGDREITMHSKEEIGRLNEKLMEKDEAINKSDREIEALKLKLHARPVSPIDGNTSKQHPGKYFLSEIMMTAGPRKPTNDRNHDGDLGEDVCGFLGAGEEILVWLLDGASQNTCLREAKTQKEYFSSRLLAQSIARKLKSRFADREMETFDKTIITILSEVKSDWLESIAALSEPEKNDLKGKLKEGSVPQCSTNALIGRLTLSGELNVYRTGDLKMYIYSSSGDQKTWIDTPLTTKNKNSWDWVFFTMILTDDDEFDIKYNKPLFEIVSQRNVQTIIGFSDGVGKLTQGELKNKYPVNADAARNEIIHQLQGTGDDKSLYIIEIKE